MGARDELPPTAPIRTGWRAELDLRPRLARLRDAWPAIAQLVVATTLAYAVARVVFGHAAPLLAVTVTVTGLGLARDARPTRVLETVLGMLAGVLVGEITVLAFGSGWWQLAIALAATLVAGQLLSRQPSFTIAAAIQSLIVLLMPGSEPGARVVDALVGGAVAVVVTAIIPRSPLRRVTADGKAVFAAFDNAMGTLVQALQRGNRQRAERALEKARQLQGPLELWRASIEGGLAIGRISPFLRRQRSELARQQTMGAQLDLAIRNLRVIARRSVYLIGDGTARPVPAELIAELRGGVGLIAQSLEDISLQPVAQEALRAVAGRLDPVALGTGTAEQNIVAELRPFVVDLLTATGLDHDRAHAALPPI
ncbi:FUSC family protein [Microbacterium sp.]|uniref:FUSC family protein n=1 Tax=Microbacterium sp. TaxID=51671 RepID=UPI003A838F99